MWCLVAKHSTDRVNKKRIKTNFIFFLNNLNFITMISLAYTTYIYNSVIKIQIFLRAKYLEFLNWEYLYFCPNFFFSACALGLWRRQQSWH